LYVLGLTNWLKNKTDVAHKKVDVVKKQSKSSKLADAASSCLVQDEVEKQVASSNVDDLSDSESDDDYAWLSMYNLLCFVRPFFSLISVFILI